MAGSVGWGLFGSGERSRAPTKKITIAEKINRVYLTLAILSALVLPVRGASDLIMRGSFSPQWHQGMYRLIRVMLIKHRGAMFSTVEGYFCKEAHAWNRFSLAVVWPLGIGFLRAGDGIGGGDWRIANLNLYLSRVCRSSTFRSSAVHQDLSSTSQRWFWVNLEFGKEGCAVVFLSDFKAPWIASLKNLPVVKVLNCKYFSGLLPLVLGRGTPMIKGIQPWKVFAFENFIY